ncbi:MAG: hypothetical protein B7X53_14320 [Hyphomonas sp. 34-62-18]|nr:hypothetical protein [Hyphomonas sp. 34-62-18]OYW89207.1 MAG: hypothetical protein B7Z22_00700 [Hyphomonas sp. 32-62-5]OZB14227.1 MAG: hypothetical protein B7X53_14320 [Hyphomonas sp. 34-62-18]
MNAEGEVSGIEAINALLRLQETLGVAEKDWAAAAGMIVKKLLLSAGQTPESLALAQAAIGQDAFNVQLKSLTHHQARQLARRLDKRVPDFEVSTASAAAAHVRKLLAAVKLPEAEPEPEPVETLDVETAAPEEAAQVPAEEAEAEKPEEKNDPWGATALSLTDDAETSKPEETGTDSTSPPPPPPPGSAYFGRKSFRT